MPTPPISSISDNRRVVAAKTSEDQFRSRAVLWIMMTAVTFAFLVMNATVSPRSSRNVLLIRNH